jgi:hypothetical protein
MVDKMSTSPSASDKEGLRHRNASIQGISKEDARRTVLELNALEDKKDVEHEKDKKTFGRTPDGTGKPSTYTLYTRNDSANSAR